MMTFQVGLPRPDLFAWLVALSGRIDDAQALEDRLPPERDQPVFIAHGTQDPLINVEQAREARDFLEAQGCRPNYYEYPMAHQITQEVLQDMVPWIHLTLPWPRRSDLRPRPTLP